MGLGDGRICNTNNCPAGIATQKKPELRKRIDVDVSSKRLQRFLESTIGLIKVMAGACVYSRSVYGKSDFGVNRERIHAWLKTLREDL